MNDYKKDFEFRQRCGILASRICTLADKYALQMITADRFTSEASALIEKEFGALHAEVERLQETQRKLATIVNDFVRIDKEGAVYRYTHNQKIDYGDLPERLKDPLVAAVIKEASDGKA